MDKYQEYLLGNVFKFYGKNVDGRGVIDCTRVEDSIEIHQNEDITITKYLLFVSCSAPVFNQIAVVECLDNNDNWINQENYFSCDNLEFKAIPVDFDNQIKKIRISSTSKMFDPIELNVKFVFADKEAYYAKVRAQEEAKRVEAQNALNAKINPACKTGDSLVNIYWDNANESVEYSVINLYSVFDRTTNRLIGKYKETGGLFKSINGLAYGDYFYEIIQFDSNGNKVAWTELIKFSLDKYPRGRNVIYPSR